MRGQAPAIFASPDTAETFFDGGVDLFHQLRFLVAELLGRHAAPSQLLLAGIDDVDHELAFMDGDRSCSSGHVAPHHEGGVERGNTTHADV